MLLLGITSAICLLGVCNSMCALSPNELGKTQEQGIITSPGYGTSATYPASQTCTWTLPGSTLSDVTIVEFTDMSVRRKGSKCRSDEVCYDGDCVDALDINVDPKFSLCGEVVPPTCYILTSKSINISTCGDFTRHCSNVNMQVVKTKSLNYSIRFTSGLSRLKRGFKLNYTTVKCSVETTPITPTTKKTTSSTTTLSGENVATQVDSRSGGNGENNGTRNFRQPLIPDGNMNVTVIAILGAGNLLFMLIALVAIIACCRRVKPSKADRSGEPPLSGSPDEQAKLNVRYSSNNEWDDVAIPPPHPETLYDQPESDEENIYMRMDDNPTAAATAGQDYDGIRQV